MPALRTLVIVGAVLLPLWLCAHASAQCSQIVATINPDYEGPIPHGISCDYATGPEETWTAPMKVESASFFVRGADDPAGGRGGRIGATLPVVPGESLLLTMGGNGEASSVSRGGTFLIVAGGGNGKAPNFVAPGTATSIFEAPGGANGEFIGDGSIYVEWQQGWHYAEVPPPVPPPDLRLQGPGPAAAAGCRVPNLTGKGAPAARRRLASANCGAGRVGGRRTGRARRGRVVAQWPLSGTELPAGSPVAFVIGRGR